MVCNGNTTESKMTSIQRVRKLLTCFLVCGGANRLSVQQYYAGVASSTSSSAPSSTVASSTTTASSAATGLPSGWAYDGCYIDGANGRIMAHQEKDNSQMSIESCVQTCIGLGYKVAGMEYSKQWLVNVSKVTRKRAADKIQFLR